MKKLPLKRSIEYKIRVRDYASSLKKRYRQEIADVFLAAVKKAEREIDNNNYCGVDVPYELAGHNVVLKEFYFNSGPAPYCLIYEVASNYVGLISLWHGEGLRSAGTLTRIWSQRRN